MSTKQVIVDTGTSYILLPSSNYLVFEIILKIGEYDYVIKYITSSKICGPDKNNNITFCICSDE